MKKGFQDESDGVDNAQSGLAVWTVGDTTSGRGPESYLIVNEYDTL